MSDVRVSLAISDFDHTRDLVDGKVPVPGVELVCIMLERVEEIFHRFASHREFDVSEMSMGGYVSGLAAGSDDLTALPVFPSRVFRQSSLFVRSSDGPSDPADLAGARIGVPNWSQTASIYTRGYLVHQCGLKLEDIDWYQAGVNQPGREEPAEIHLPAGVSLTPVPDRTLTDMLLEGDLDAFMSARPPQLFTDGDPRIRRLFEDPRSVEEDYYRETGIMPIMHVMAMRRDVFEANRWIAMNLYNAFEEAKQRSVERALDRTATRFPFCWGADHAEEMAELFDGDLFPYGLEPNRPTLEAFLGYAYEQGVAGRLLEPEELFPEEVLSTFRV